MRPIGVGEIPRQIIAKAVLGIIGRDIEDAAGPSQVCAGQQGGCEVAVHAMRKIFQHPKTEGVYWSMPPMPSTPSAEELLYTMLVACVRP